VRLASASNSSKKKSYFIHLFCRTCNKECGRTAGTVEIAANRLKHWRFFFTFDAARGADPEQINSRNRQFPRKRRRQVDVLHFAAEGSDCFQRLWISLSWPKKPLRTRQKLVTLAKAFDRLLGNHAPAAARTHIDMVNHVRRADLSGELHLNPAPRGGTNGLKHKRSSAQPTVSWPHLKNLRHWITSSCAAVQNRIFPYAWAAGENHASQVPG